MVYKIIEVFVEKGFVESLDKISNKKEIIDFWKIENQEGRVKYSMVLEEKDTEMIVDSISKILHFTEDVDTVKDVDNIMILSAVEGFLPKIKSIEEGIEKSRKNSKSVDRISTEEMYEDIQNGTRITQNFTLNVILATIVCAVGIIKNSTSILLAASSIAPFLGSILAFSFSLPIGDKWLNRKALKTFFFGMLLSVSIGCIIGFCWSYLPGTYEIAMDTNIFQEMQVNQYTFILALASGASASLAITAGTPTMMAGFMVAVSLLPNMTIAGITLGDGLYGIFLNSILLLFINLMCIIFSSQIIFLFKKIKPKTKEAEEVFKTNSIAVVIFYSVVLAILVALKMLAKNIY